MTQPRTGPRPIAIVIAVIGLFGCAAVAAQSDAQNDKASDNNERPVYIEIVPIADADKSVLPDDVVTAMAREALSSYSQSSIRLNDKKTPANVNVLRILYVVHQQSQHDDRLSLAASASTQLLHTMDEGDKVLNTLLLYSGLQQSLVQGKTIQKAREKIRAAFKKQLQQRIDTAFEKALP